MEVKDKVKNVEGWNDFAIRVKRQIHLTGVEVR